MPVIAAAASASASPKGSYISIASAKITSTTGAITFSNIPQGYQDLFISATIRTDPTTFSQSSLTYYVNPGVASATAGFSVTNLRTYGGGTAQSTRYTTTTTVYGFSFAESVLPTMMSAPNLFSSAQAHIFNYSSTTRFKTAILSNAGETINSGSMHLAACLWQNTAAITGLQLATNGNFVAGTTLSLYGIRSVGQ
jgi:hypothetical protein